MITILTELYQEILSVWYQFLLADNGTECTQFLSILKNMFTTFINL